MDKKYRDNQLNVEYIPILKYFKDIFLEEILGLPLKRDIYFTIDFNGTRGSTNINGSLSYEHIRTYLVKITNTRINR